MEVRNDGSLRGKVNEWDAHLKLRPAVQSSPIACASVNVRVKQVARSSFRKQLWSDWLKELLAARFWHTAIAHSACWK
jgi:hypothetical protein